MLPPTQTFTPILVGHKTILFFLLKLLSCNLKQHYVGYLLISCSVFFKTHSEHNYCSSRNLYIFVCVDLIEFDIKIKIFATNYCPTCKILCI